jgi:hypothetical protein
VLPIIVYFVVHITSPQTTFKLLVAGAIVFYLLATLRLIRHFRQGVAFRRIEMFWAFLVVSGAILVLLELNDIVINDHLVANNAIGDHIKHVLLTDAISRSGVPPANPSFSPDGSQAAPQPTAYYYFEAMIASVLSGLNPDRLSNGRDAFTALTACTSIELAAIIALYLRLTRGAANAARHALIGWGLLSVSGFDVFPALLGSENNRKYVDIWNWKAQVTSWHASILWVPQHVAGLIACVMALLLFQAIKHEPSNRHIVKYGVLAALTLASAVGLSVWVTFAFAAFWICYIGMLLVGKNVRLALVGIAIGILSLFFASLFLKELLQASSATKSPVEIHPLVLDFQYVKYFHFGSDRGVYRIISLIAAAVVMYGLELGFYFLAGVIFVARRSVLKSHPEVAAEMALLVVTLIIVSFLRSTIMYNDLGWRAFLLAQFVLLIWGVDVITTLIQGRPILIGLVILTISIGVFGRGVDFVLMRATFNRNQPTREMFYIRKTYLYLRQHTPPSARIQQSPEENFTDAMHGLYSDRQSVMTNLTHAIVFGTPQRLYRPVFLDLVPEFWYENATDPSYAQSLCTKYHIDYLVFKWTDVIWHTQGAWIWRFTPWYETPLTRVFSCKAISSY